MRRFPFLFTKAARIVRAPSPVPASVLYRSNSVACRAHVCDTASVSQVQGSAGTFMVRRNSVSFRLSLAAVLFGLYGLCMTGGTRASVAEQCAALRHADPAAFDANPATAGHLRGVSHLRMERAVRRASAPTSLFQAASVITPDFVATALARENALALGGAPRAAGPSRAPPAASKTHATDKADGAGTLR
jgi:hypothetical protein